MLNDVNANKYYDYVINLFFYDTISLLDLVLFDDEADPEYSAVMAYNRLLAYLKLTSDFCDSSADDRIKKLLLESGYSEADIHSFMNRKKAEEPRYEGTILPY